MNGLRRAFGRLLGAANLPIHRGSVVVGPRATAHVEASARLVDRLKAELRARYARGERPSAREYLARFAGLREDRALAVSLIYEEFCLLEEVGRRPDTGDFCRRYPRWEDSLELQLRCHRELAGAAAIPSFPQPGDHFQGFWIGPILGRGGTSQVYMAYEDAMGGRPVALKVSPDHGPETDIIGRLDHPRIMPAFSTCRDEARGLRGLCMPYRPGLPLDGLIRRSRPLAGRHGAAAFWHALAAEQDHGAVPAPSLDWPAWLGFPAAGTYEEAGAWITLAVAQAAAHLHASGIVHCDIKPSNVYVGVRDGPLLLDFGMARSGRAGDAIPGGTPAYMAPEQLRALSDPGRRAEVGPAADVYALGLTLAELLLGAPPGIPPRTVPPLEAVRELLGRRSRPGGPAWPAPGLVASALEEIIRRCLAPAREMRYADARALVRDLAGFLASAAPEGRAPRQQVQV